MRKPLSHLTNFVERHPILSVVYLFLIFRVLRQFVVEGTVEVWQVGLFVLAIVLPIIRMRVDTWK